VLYDNDRCLVAKILPDGTRKRTKLFSGFLSHYVSHDRYGRPGKGRDKGAVEGLVGYAPRQLFSGKPLPGNGPNFMVPIPRFATWDAGSCAVDAGQECDLQDQRSLTANRASRPCPASYFPVKTHGKRITFWIRCSGLGFSAAC
jgi:hypothetical protein